VRDIVSSDHMFLNVSNCQIVIMNNDTCKVNVAKALEVLKVRNVAEQLGC
jgi:hypothetical protein